MIRAIAVAAVISALGYAPQKGRPSAKEVMSNVAKTYEAVDDFVVTLEGEVHMERLEMPKTTVTMYYKKPAKTHFSSAGFAMLPREGMMLNPAQLQDRYDATLQGEETADGAKRYKLQLAAKDPQARVRQMYVWVDPSNWTIVKTESVPYEGRNLTFEFKYGLQQGKYWLPVSMKATFGAAAPAPDRSGSDLSQTPAAALEEMQRAPRSGTVEITYSNYRVNVNLPDGIFEEKSGK